jgi:hypothetical protein
MCGAVGPLSCTSSRHGNQLTKGTILPFVFSKNIFICIYNVHTTSASSSLFITVKVNVELKF